MRKKRELLDNSPDIFNLDSLVDIVSNKVGILLILAVFMAMFTLIERNEQFQPKEELTTDIEKIKIPWAHDSQKNSLLFLLRNERILFLDRALVFKKLKQYLSGKTPLPTQISLKDFSIKLTTGNGHAHCIEFFPYMEKGNWWHQVYKRDGLIQNLFKNYPSEENYFFFWVDKGSFKLFHEIRSSLWKENYEVGWKPIRKESSLRYCSGNHQSQNFKPQ